MRFLAIALFVFSLLSPSHLLAEPPPVQLASLFDESISVENYWISEKYDGVRAYWDGKQLMTRSGRPINAPQWYIADFPDFALDGELWIKHNAFAEVSGIVRKNQPSNSDWRNISYMIFDFPTADGTFSQRISAMRKFFSNNPVIWLRMVDQTKIANLPTLYQQLDRVVGAGGEGLMLHRGDAYHQSSRTDALLKLKKYQDAEAQVVAHVAGKAKYQGMLGALLVKLSDGREFKIGTGFSDADRQNPPPIGSQITFRYTGYTASGLPRFASFLRIRPAE